MLKRCVDPKTGPKLVTVIPASLRKKILYSMHDDPLSGHLGTQKTYEKMRSRFYFPQMRKYINYYVKSCAECQTRKRTYMTPAGLLQPMTCGGVAERFGIDILGPFPKSYKDNKQIVVATEYFTRFAIVRALPEETASQIAMFITENIVCQFGSPKEILTDQGRQFRSKLMNEITFLMQTKHRFTTAYHPQCNGLTERFNSTLSTMISMYVDNSHKNWDQALHFVAFAYNTAINASTGFSPFYLMYGREAVFPIERFINNTTQGLTDQKNYADTLIDHLMKIRKIAIENLEQSQQRNKNYYDKKRRDIKFKVGQKVLVFTPLRKVGKSEKLMHNWYGPYEIIEVMSPLVYKLQHLEKRNKIDLVHISRIKVYESRDESKLYDIGTKDNGNNNDTEEEEDEEIEQTLPMQISLRPKSVRSPPEVSSSRNEHLNSEIETEIDEANQPPQKLIKPIVNYNLESDTEIEENEEQDINQNLNRTTSRPTRTRAPPKKLANYFLFGIILPSLFSYSLTSFTKINPVVWNEKKTNIITGIQQITVKVKFESPCHLFTDQKSNHTEFFKPLENWCHRTFDQDFIRPIKNLCPEIEKINKREIRNKRSIISGIFILGTTVISSFFSVGLGAITLSKEATLEYRTDEIESIQRTLLEQISSQKLEQSLIRTALNSMQSSLKEMTKFISKFDQRLERLENNLPNTIYLASHLTSRFMKIQETLKKANRKWHSGEFETSLLDLFNISLPCKETCPTTLLEPIDCSLDLQENEINIHLDAKIIDINSHLLIADPFHLFTLMNSSHICYTDYTGPSKILYDKRQDCVTKTNNFIELDHNQIMIAPNKLDCQIQKNVSLNNLWSPSVCLPKSNHTDSSYQIKFVKHFNFVYCPFRYIKIFSKNHDCPNFVFQIPSNISFELENYVYQPQSMRTKVNMKFSNDWNFRLNMHLNPSLLDPLLQTMETTDKILSEKSQVEIITLWKNRATSSVIILVIVLLICSNIGLAFYLIKLKERGKDKQKPKEEVVIPQKKPLLRKSNLKANTEV